MRAVSPEIFWIIPVVDLLFFCSLALVGAGPLGDPLVQNGGVASAPAIAATANGFLLAYREYDPLGGQAAEELDLSASLGLAPSVAEAWQKDVAGRWHGGAHRYTRYRLSAPLSGRVGFAHASVCVACPERQLIDHARGARLL